MSGEVTGMHRDLEESIFTPLEYTEFEMAMGVCGACGSLEAIVILLVLLPLALEAVGAVTVVTSPLAIVPHVEALVQLRQGVHTQHLVDLTEGQESQSKLSA